MKIQILGAAGGEVTGSAYLVQTEKTSILIDAGMFQGGKEADNKNKLQKDANPAKLNAILLTHGHLDHSGRIPLLVKYGFKGPIYSTVESLELSQIILEDSARLQIADAMRHNRKHWKPGKAPAEPLYSTEHVQRMKEMGVPVKLEEHVIISEDITARWIEAGHMLGSGSIELSVNEGGRIKIVVFSGDLGPVTMPLLKPFDHFNKADLVFLESTYGDRDHKSYEETIHEFESIISKASESGDKILVPTFAIGRAQQIIYHLAELFHSKKVKPFPVYLDSPMALKAFDVYRHHQDILDDEYQELKRRGVFPLEPQYFIPSETAEQSKALNNVKGACMILAGAGMVTGGRILHHLLHSIENPNAHILIVGYQGRGSTGRKLVDRWPIIRMFGQEKALKAQVHTLNGFSAHAGQTDLLSWFSYLAPSKPKVVLTHGEDGPRKALAKCIKDRFGLDATLPNMRDLIEI
jgi:metallo-beta-lactamase family protein